MISLILEVSRLRDSIVITAKDVDLVIDGSTFEDAIDNFYYQVRMDWEDYLSNGDLPTICVDPDKFVQIGNMLFGEVEEPEEEVEEPELESPTDGGE